MTLIKCVSTFYHNSQPGESEINNGAGADSSCVIIPDEIDVPYTVCATRTSLRVRWGVRGGALIALVILGLCSLMIVSLFVTIQVPGLQAVLMSIKYEKLRTQTEKSARHDEHAAPGPPQLTFAH